MGSLSWIPPLVSFSIIVGIGLDYDIFLITRVQEFRNEKFSTKDSIIKGMEIKTGNFYFCGASKNENFDIFDFLAPSHLHSKFIFPF